MLYNIGHSALIQPTLPSFLGFWQAGIDAFSVNMTYATAAVGSGMPLDDFMEISRSQLAKVDFIGREYHFFMGDYFDFPSQHRFAASRFNHDILSRELSAIRLWADVVSLSPDDVVEWHKFSKSMYRLDPTMEVLTTNLINRRLTLATDSAVRGKNGLSNNYKFANERVLKGVKIVFENLIDNAVKYARADGNDFTIYNHNSDPTIIIYSDYGIGMDPAFAARLGHEDLIREERAEGVDGSGIGWASIGRTARELGWTWEIKTAPGEGTVIILKIKESDIVPVDPKTEAPEVRFTPVELIPASRFVDGARVFTEASPLAGYTVVDGPDGEMIDISQSPIFRALIESQPVLKLLKRAVSRIPQPVT